MLCCSLGKASFTMMCPLSIPKLTLIIGAVTSTFLGNVFLMYKYMHHYELKRPTLRYSNLRPEQ